MTFRLFCNLVGTFLVLTIASGCSVNTPTDSNYEALIASDPLSIVVLPPLNDSVEVNASYTFLSTISRPLVEKGYYVFPVAVIDTFLKENGLPTPAEMNSVALDKIRENIGADAVLYVHIRDWGQKYQILSSNTVVSADLSLVDTQTGDQLWVARASATRSSSNNNSSGLVGALVGAVVDQIAGSLSDHTHELSRDAAFSAVNDSRRGLLDGPYLRADGVEP